MSATFDLDPLELYDLVLSDTQDLDKKLGGTRTQQFIAKFGTREEYAKKITFPQVPTQ